MHALKLLLKRFALLRATNARVKAFWLVLLRARERRADCPTDNGRIDSVSEVDRGDRSNQ